MPKSEIEKAYLAGILDGEGCFNIHKNTNKVSFTARIMVGMSDPRILKLFHDEYGGNIQFYESKTIKHKDAWMWYATGNTLEKLLVDVMPYLIIKKPQAEIVLELRNSMKTHVHFVRGKKGTQCVPQDIMEYRQGLKNKINFLNRTGKADICLAS